MGVLQISVIEDNPADVFLLEHTIEQLGLNCALTIACDGEEGVDCLLRRNKFANCPKADLILLDMHLPKLTGLEILQSVPEASLLPICMLTSSEAERRTIEAALSRPVVYLLKPIAPELLLNCLRNYHLEAEVAL